MLSRFLLSIGIVVALTYGIKGQNSNQLIPVKVNYKWGFISTEGEIKIEPKFVAIKNFEFGLSVAQLGEKVGVIDSSSSWVIEPEFDQILLINENYLAVREENKWKIINTQKRVVLDQIMTISRITSSLVLVENNEHRFIFNVELLKKFEAPFDAVSVRDEYLIIRKSNNYGLLSFSLDLLYEPVYTDLPLIDSKFLILKKNDRFAIGSTEGYLYCDFIYSKFLKKDFEAIELYREGYRIDLFDITNNTLITNSFKVEEYFRVTNELIGFASSRRVGLFGSKGQLILQPEFNEIRDAGNLLITIKFGKKGLVNKNGEVLFKPIFDRIGKFENGLAYVEANGGIGVIKETGEILVKPIFDFVEILDHQVKIYKNGSMWLLTLKDNKIVENIFFNNVKQIRIDSKFVVDDLPSYPIRSLSQREDSIAMAYGWRFNTNTGKWGLVDNDGNLRIKYVFDKVHILSDTFSIVERAEIKKYSMNDKLTRPKMARVIKEHEGSFILAEQNYFQFINHRDYTNVSDRNFWYVDYNELRNGPSAKAIRYGLPGIVQRNGNFATDLTLPGSGSTSARISTIGSYMEDISRVCVNGFTEYVDLIENRTLKDGYDSLMPGVAERRIGGRCGFVSRDGRLIIDPIYDDVSDFQYGRAIVSAENKKGVIDNSGQILLPTEYQDVKIVTLKSDPYFILKREQLTKGIISENGKVIVPADYTDIGQYSEELFWFESAGKFGFLNKKGDQVILPQFYGAKSFSSGLAPVKINNLWGYIDKQGKIKIEPAFREAFDFIGEIARVRVNLETRYINKSGEFIQGEKLAAGEDFSQGYAIAKKSGYGLIDSLGNWIIPPKYDKLIVEQNYSIVIAKKRRKYYLLNFKNEKVIDENLFKIDPFQEGKALVKFKKGYGFINQEGEVVLQGYSNAQSFSDSLAKVRIIDKWYFVNHTGEKIFQVPYNQTTNFKEGRIFFYSGGKYGIMDKKGQIIIEPELLRYEEYSEGKAMVCDEKDSVRCYYINKDGLKIFGDLTFQNGKSFEDNIAAIQKDDKWQVINDQGFKISSDKMDNIEAFHKGYAIYHFIEKLGVYDINAKEVLETKYNQILPESGNLFRVESGDQLGYYHIQKGWVWPLTK